MNYDIHTGDLMAWAASYDGPPYHALLCDPPYHLTEGRPGVVSKGFMGRAWDGGDIAFRPETWAALAAHLHPGAYGMAFASTRGYHRMACAIEDAGLNLIGMMCWSFGSGFPKATRIDTQVDRRAGAEQEIVSEWRTGKAGTLGGKGAYSGLGGEDVRRVRRPATDLAAAWEGHRYGGQALKPAIEPIVLFQRPYAGRPVESITRTGAGAINIDQARIGDVSTIATHRADIGYHGGLTATEYTTGSHYGRWPANLLLSHNPDCNGACTPGCAVTALGEQSGEAGGAPGERHRRASDRSEYWAAGGGGYRAQSVTVGHDDSGTAARFFFNADSLLDRIDNPVRYVAKASTWEREAGLGEGDGRRNLHPTIKPIDLCRYLATLLLPPARYAPRRILVPFAGSGSEMIGAGLAGWEHCTGVELEAEHVALARARLAWWVDVFGGRDVE